MPEAVIVDAVRTPIGRAAKGSLKDVRADDLAAIPLEALVERRRLAARVPAQRADWPATRPPTLAERATRLRGGESAIYSRVRSPAPRGTID
jgi:acetyl-CoA acetyltransferase